MSEEKNSKVSGRKITAFFLDAIVSVTASLFSILFVRWITSPVFGFSHNAYIWLSLSLAASVAAILIVRTHRIVIRHSTVSSVGKLLTASVVKEMFMTAFVLLGLFHFSRESRLDVLILVTDLLLTSFMLVITRVVIMALYRDMNGSLSKIIDRIPIMLYGTSDKAAAMVIRLENSPHYSVAGLLTRDRSKNGMIVQDCRCYCFSDEKDLEALKVNIGFKNILFVREEDAVKESVEGGLVQLCFKNGIQCLSAPRIDQMDLGGMTGKIVSSVNRTSIDYIPDGMTGFERNVKRFIDFLLATVLLVVFSPLFLICYIALKIGDHGPAIYKQERIGRFGRPFYIYKFRSMRVDAEQAGPALYAGDDDPRLTRVGKFLRLHHLDELPQLFNVWRGDMAFVGPRPERKYFIDQIMERDPRYYFLYQIRPGVTSYATLKNGYTDTMDKMLRRLEFDLYYLRHRSWWFDMKVLWQTFTNIVFGKRF